MEAKLKKNCPGCNRFYCLKSPDSKSNANLPVFLSCGHCMCENCITNLVKFAEPIECKVCHKDMQVDPKDLELITQNKISLRSFFPVNVYMVGELALQTIELQNDNVECYLDIKALIKSTENFEGECLECHKPTSTLCTLCRNRILCSSCFKHTHNFTVFDDHQLSNIVTPIQNCSTHKGKPLEYYCHDCDKPICMNCLVTRDDKSCKDHNAVSINEVNENFLRDVIEIQPKVDEVFRRLTKSAVDIGHLLTKLSDRNSTTDYTNLINKIDAHYSKLHSILQAQKEDITNRVLKQKSTEIESLQKAKNEIAENIKKSKTTLNTINGLDPKNLQQYNLAFVLEQAKQVVKAAWYLKREDSEPSFNVAVKEDIYTSVNDFVQLECKDNSAYKLCSTDELSENNEDIPAPPKTVVYPPEFVNDVREKYQAKNNPLKDNVKAAAYITQMPKYRSKSGSVSSLNSANSDSSHKNFYTYDNKPLVELVNPFPETQQVKQLVEGSKELIYISHIVDPHNFYVQRACEQPRVEELIREFRTAAAVPKPSVSHVAEGKMYLAYNKVDNLWLRGLITSIDRKDANKPIFHVFSIDFGSTEAVTIDDLRLIPPLRIHSPPPFALNCSLANCKPINGSWTDDDSFLIQKIIDNKQAAIHVKRISSTLTGCVRLECDVTTFEDGTSIAHALAFHGRARIPLNLPYPKMKGVIENPKLFMGCDCKKFLVEQVFITHIVSPDNFFVREVHLEPVFEKLSEDLDHEYSLSVKVGSIYLPEKNMVCVANVEKCSLGMRWARAVVQELPGRGRVRVLLPDVGASVILHWTALRRLHTKFTVQRALAKGCHLAGVTPLNKKWNVASVTLLQSFQGKELELHVDDNRNRYSLGVILYDKSNDEEVICINKQMIKQKFAISFGLCGFDNNKEKEELVKTHKSPLEQPKPKPMPKGQVSLLTKKTEVKKPKEGELEAKDKGPLRLEAKILTYQSPSIFYISLVHQQRVFIDLFDNLQDYYAKTPTQGKTEWTVGDKCCTLCHQSETWRRAVILEINNENAKVFYSDFATVENVSVSSLRELPEELAAIGDAAILCHLYGVIPAVGEEWPSLTKEYLKELLDAYNRIFITKVGQFKGKSMPVELWVYHTIQGGALEPNKSEWRCLNKKVIEQGLGIPDKDLVKETKKEKEQSKNPADDMLSFLNITGSVRDWLQIEPMQLKPLQPKQDHESNPSTTSPVDVDAQDEGGASNTVFISDWLPAEALLANEFTATPTYIDNDGVIYLHDITQHDTLDLIRKALDVRFSNRPDPKAKYVKWTVGEPCIALYFLDNRFYRGRVLEVNKETSSCLIHYIDYGNEEHCPFENIRKSLVLYQIPTQAHKCVLSRICPAQKYWNTQSLDYIHKSIVEKPCYVKVTGPPTGGVIPIELKYDKLWINDHLVDIDLAVYTDGTKAVVRKYAPKGNESQKLEESMESDSGPDYIVACEGNSNPISDKSDNVSLQSFVNKDWVKLMDEDASVKDNFMTYSPFNETNFRCCITVLNELDKLELVVVHDDETYNMYENMFKELRDEGENMPALCGIYENKPCLAMLPNDDQWYRALILQYSEAKRLIKVKCVDYGNKEVIPVTNVREITEKYTRLPPAAVTATLHGYKANPEIDKNNNAVHFTKTFFDKEPFNVMVIDDSNIIPSVELRDDDNKLVYESLIEQNFLVATD